MRTGDEEHEGHEQEARRLRREIERALSHAFDPANVLPRLARLLRLAPESSDDGIFANRTIAELLVEHHPWRAAIHARRAIHHRDSDDRAWAILAFSHTLLGNFRSAASAYKKAIACTPSNPWYAHNLGHLFDVALGEPKRALPWLKAAFLAQSENSEIVASYVHALAGAGQKEQAKNVLDRALERGMSREPRELQALQRWLAAGAPSRRVHERTGTPPPVPKPKRTRASDRRLMQVLERGLTCLPLDDHQRERARRLARDVAEVDRAPALDESSAPPRTRDLSGLAAAVAYAIVYVDHVPLSPAEVAASFRVRAAELRGRFTELRAKLDLIRGDARYTTMRH